MVYQCSVNRVKIYRRVECVRESSYVVLAMYRLRHIEKKIIYMKRLYLKKYSIVYGMVFAQM